MDDQVLGMEGRMVGGVFPLSSAVTGLALARLQGRNWSMAMVDGAASLFSGPGSFGIIALVPTYSARMEFVGEMHR